MKSKIKEEIGYDDYTQKKVRKFETIEGMQDGMRMILVGISKLEKLTMSDYIEPEIKKDIQTSMAVISNEMKNLSEKLVTTTINYVDNELTPADELTLNFNLGPQTRSLNEINQSKINRIKELIKK